MKTIYFFKSTFLLLSIILFGMFESLNAQSSLLLPPHNSIYSFNVRGYWFVAPDNFIITGLKVPKEAGSGKQNIQVFKINGDAAVYPLNDTNFTNLIYIKGAKNNVVQDVNIIINAGDTIGVFGSSETDVSYSANDVTPFTTTILGHPVALNRLIYQGSININQAPNYSIDNKGQIGRVELYYTCISPKADNINAKLVSGCIFNFNLTNDKYASTYEWDFGDGSPRASGSATAHAYSKTGSYVVKAVLKSKCDSTILLKAVTCSVSGIENTQIKDDNISLYPNPATNLLTIKAENGVNLKEITIYNLLGEKVYQENAQNQNLHSLNISSIPSGIYSVFIQENEEMIIRRLEVLK